MSAASHWGTSCDLVIGAPASVFLLLAGGPAADATRVLRANILVVSAPRICWGEGRRCPHPPTLPPTHPTPGRRLVCPRPLPRRGPRCGPRRRRRARDPCCVARAPVCVGGAGGAGSWHPRTSARRRVGPRRARAARGRALDCRAALLAPLAVVSARPLKHSAVFEPHLFALAVDVARPASPMESPPHAIDISYDAGVVGQVRGGGCLHGVCRVASTHLSLRAPSVLRSTASRAPCASKASYFLGVTCALPSRSRKAALRDLALGRQGK